MRTWAAGVGGLPWLGLCVGLGAAWLALAAWRTGDPARVVLARGGLGGLVALAAAAGGYGALELAGVPVRWEWLSAGSWPAMRLALLIGLVEEGAKLAGLLLAIRLLLPGSRARVVSSAIAVATVFAVAEAAVALRGASWALALPRVALAPVAHALLLAPAAVVLADHPPAADRARRLALALLAAASLHAGGDLALAESPLGGVGFACSLLVPALWLFGRARVQATRAGAPRLLARLSVTAHQAMLRRERAARVASSA